MPLNFIDAGSTDKLAEMLNEHFTCKPEAAQLLELTADGFTPLHTTQATGSGQVCPASPHMASM